MLSPKEMYCDFQDEIILELFGDSIPYWELSKEDLDKVSNMVIERSREAVADAIDSARDYLKYRIFSLPKEDSVAKN